MSDEKVIEDPEQLDILMKRYCIIGAIVVGNTEFMQWRHDEQGNQLRITAKAGSDALTYQEIAKKGIDG